MKLTRLTRLAACLVMAGSLLLGYAGLSAAAQAPGQAPAATLTSGDCIKCHAGPPSDVAKAGAGHSRITCQDCHTGHRPSSKNNIPQCSTCHSGKPHYELKGCLGCHRNPHTPLNITMSGNITDPCLTCHTPQIKQLRENKSKHSALFCSTCHNVHGKVPPCVQCHKPHSSDMVQADCKKCHKAHMPKAVTYGSDVPNKNCGACHKRAFDLLAASKAKHRTLACVYCHKDKHRTVPKCQDCHGVPHPAGMMSRFPKCSECHNIAHDLNNWSATGQKAPAAAVKEIKKDLKKKR